MSSHLAIDERKELREIREPYFPESPAFLKWPALIFSYLLHPVFIPLYVIWFLVYVHPFLFTGFTDMQKTKTMIMAFVSFTFFPLVTVFLLKALKFIESIHLRTQKDRVIPFIACMIWYFWIAYVWFNFGKTRDVVDMPVEAVQFAFAAFFSTILGLMVNIKMKVSLHAISAGLVLTFFIMMAIAQPLHFGSWLTVVFILTGLTCTSRFLVSDHTPVEVYGGLVTGALSMLIGNQLLYWLS